MRRAVLLLAFSLNALAAEPCVMAPDNARFLQKAISEWERGAREILRVEPTPLPWVVAYDVRCTWHLAPGKEVGEAVDVDFQFAGARVPVRAVVHEGEVVLPGGGPVPGNRAMAFTSLYDDGAKPFFVIALLDVWRLDPKAAVHPRLEAIIMGAVTHEIVHTRQLVAIGKRIGELQKQHPVLPENISDDSIEEWFSKDPAFKAAIDREIDLLFDAGRATSRRQRVRLLRKAFKMMRDRRARFYTGERRAYAELEDLFLNMEGVATITSHRLGYSTESEGKLTRGRNSWSQDHGFILFYLIDQLVPNWQHRALTGLETPRALLARALD